MAGYGIIGNIRCFLKQEVRMSSSISANDAIHAQNYEIPEEQTAPPQEGVTEAREREDSQAPLHLGEQLNSLSVVGSSNQQQQLGQTHDFPGAEDGSGLIGKLPGELRNEITNYLSPQDLFNLSKTNTAFKNDYLKQAQTSGQVEQATQLGRFPHEERQATLDRALDQLPSTRSADRPRLTAELSRNYLMARVSQDRRNSALKLWSMIKQMPLDDPHLPTALQNFHPHSVGMEKQSDVRNELLDHVERLAQRDPVAAGGALRAHAAGLAHNAPGAAAAATKMLNIRHNMMEAGAPEPLPETYSRLQEIAGMQDG
jgi:hypothetical protein